MSCAVCSIGPNLKQGADAFRPNSVRIRTWCRLISKVAYCTFLYQALISLLKKSNLLHWRVSDRRRIGVVSLGTPPHTCQAVVKVCTQPFSSKYQNLIRISSAHASYSLSVKRELFQPRGGETLMLTSEETGKAIRTLQQAREKFSGRKVSHLGSHGSHC
jgi:hypothetical protein